MQQLLKHIVRHGDPQHIPDYVLDLGSGVYSRLIGAFWARRSRQSDSQNVPHAALGLGLGSRVYGSRFLVEQ